MSRGRYIVIEGHDGTGKSTQVQLLREYLSAQGIESVEFHEPEGTPISKELRAIIVNGDLSRRAETNLLMFTAARHEIWQSVALPALRAGKWVIASRNYYSTIAYQGYGEGIDIALIESITCSFTDETYMNPDLAIVLSVESDEERNKRITLRGELTAPDPFESRQSDFQEKVRDAYLAIAKKKQATVIAAEGSPKSVHEQIVHCVDAL